MANECIPYLDPADNETCYVGAAVTGKRCVAISGVKTDGLTQVSPAGAGVKVYGVAARDAATGARVMVFCVGVVPVLAGGAISAGASVKPDATGKAVAAVAGDWAFGVAVDDIANAADGPIRLGLHLVHA